MAHISRLHWLPIAGVLATLTIAGAGWDQTQARSPRSPPPRAIHGPSYRPPYAAIVIDDKSGFVLHEASADEPRHPASLTKIMTLYLLFEQLEAGKLKLDTPSADLDAGCDSRTPRSSGSGPIRPSRSRTRSRAW